MSGKTFLDTNIVVYLYSGDEPEKRAAALALIEQNHSIVSTQVLSELANTLSRKFGLSFDVVAQAVAEVRVEGLTLLTADKAVAKYGDGVRKV